VNIRRRVILASQRPRSSFILSHSRVEQFVYVPTKDSFFSILDQHADTLEGDVKPPLVLVGNEGKLAFTMLTILNSLYPYTIYREW
jgi:hypothetical protein